ncbi:hypothetical protein H6504_00630 [Candidatus Woesearchaeota archaeon]|nr:hypothetical protein [Candidatus Woesearchaeota archaeon]
MTPLEGKIVGFQLLGPLYPSYMLTFYTAHGHDLMRFVDRDGIHTKDGWPYEFIENSRYHILPVGVRYIKEGEFAFGISKQQILVGTPDMLSKELTDLLGRPLENRLALELEKYQKVIEEIIS